MRRRDFVIGGLLAAAGGVTWAQVPPGVPRMALVVGNSAYKNITPVLGAPNDVNAMTGALQGLGFSVQRAMNLTDRQFQDVIEEFARKVRAAGAMSLVYLSGWGVSLRGSVRFVGLGDVPLDSENNFERYSTNLSWVLSTLGAARIAGPSRPPVILIADIDTTGNINPKASLVKEMAQSISVERGSFVALASAPGNSAMESADGRHGMFTSHLVPALQMEGLSLAQVAARVRDAVSKESKGSQIPWSASVELDANRIILKPAVPRDDPTVRGRSARGG